MNPIGNLSDSRVRRVHVLRPDNLGDVVLFSGAFRHLRALFPNAYITVWTRKYAREVLTHCPYIDEVRAWEDLVKPFHGLGPRFRARWRLERLLGAICSKMLTPADILLLPVRSPTREMHDVARRIRARARFAIAGDLVNQTAEDNAYAAEVYTGQLAFRGESGSPELEVTRDFLRFLGADIQTADVWPSLWTEPGADAWARRHVTRLPGEALVAVAPGVTSNPSRRFSPEKLARSIAALGRPGIHVVILGSRSEISSCDECAAVLAESTSIQRVTNLAGLTTVHQLVAALKICDFVVSQETAALHIATALGKPTVGVLGGGHFGRFYPWGNPEINKVVYRRMPCFHCNWDCRFETVRCVEQIVAELVTRELQRLWAHRTDSASRGPSLSAV